MAHDRSVPTAANNLGPAAAGAILVLLAQLANSAGVTLVAQRLNPTTRGREGESTTKTPFDPYVPDPTDIPHPLTRPSRWPVVLGFAGLVAGWFLPWATSPDGVFRYGASILTADSRAGDGITAVFFGLVLLGLAVSRQVADSRTRVIQLAPAIVGIATAFIILPSLNWTQDAVDQAIAIGSPASISPGWAVEWVAVGLCVFGGVVMTIDLSITHRVVPEPGLTTGLDADFAASVAVGLAGIALGVWSAFMLSGLMGSEAYTERLLFLLVGGILLGPALAVATWRGLRRSRQRP